MIDQLQVIPKEQVLENNRVERSLALALQKASIPRPISAHRALLINYFLEQVILQNQSDENKSIKTIAFRGIIKLTPHNRNPLLKPYSTFITLNSIIEFKTANKKALTLIKEQTASNQNTRKTKRNNKSHKQ
ncbi:hypothetical protein FIM40_07365 [Helicobacter pylori]|nr:hypothetical protein [Helicobacter pylori]TPH94027.1 hypothetical protein FIM40_07365 [Helicobacter pylori]